MNYTSESIKSLCFTVLKGFGCNDNEADIVASHLVLANLSGHDSHGIGMLPMYGKQLQDGNLVANQTPDFSPATGAVSLVDAKRGFGHHMAIQSLDYAMQTIPEHKVAILGMRNAGHVSRIGTYSEYCASKGYVSIHMVNVIGHAPIVAPHGARESGFSTNPISMAMPMNNVAKPMLDMATSKVAFGKARVAHNKGEQMAPGCLIDVQGLPTGDPGPMVERREGSLSAFGDHKGSGLGIFVELMAGALVNNGTIATEDHIANGAINSMFSVILDPAAFGGSQTVAKETMDFYQFIKDKNPAQGTDEVLMPGEPEERTRIKRQTEGLPVDEETIRQIVEIGGEFKLDTDELQSQLKTL